MGTSAEDRRQAAYVGATTLSQAELDETFAGGENQIEAIGILTRVLTKTFTITIASPGVVTTADTHVVDGDPFVISTTGALPTGLAPGTYYVRGPVLTVGSNVNFELAATLGGPGIDTTGSQSGVHSASRTYILRFADRPKFVGDDFYEGRAKFPIVKRTLGELQTPSLQFSEMEVELANLDGFYNRYLDGGADYFNLIGSNLVIKLGLRDVLASFITIFDGTVPDQDGYNVARERITIRARDKFDALNRVSPLPYINLTDYPSAPDESLGKVIPLVLGDWGAGYSFTANASQVSVPDGSGGNVLVKADAPDGTFYGGVTGYYVGGGVFIFAVGTYLPDDATYAHIKRGDQMLQVNLQLVSGHNVVQAAGYYGIQVNSLVDTTGAPASYVYQSGDIAIIAVRVPYDAAPKYKNAIEIAQQLLYTLALKTSGDLDATSWAALAAKSTPTQSDMTSLKCRIWIGRDEASILGIILDLLEQVRVEMFINSAGKIALKSLHPEDFPAPASAYRIDQSQINEESISQTADLRNFFNKAQVSYAFTPVTGKTELATPLQKNQDSIDLTGKTVAKDIALPWLYDADQAALQLVEFLRFYSGGVTFVTMEVAWVHLLRDLGDFMSVNYAEGSLEYDEVPMQVRDFQINPATGAVTFKMLSFANFSYTAYSPPNVARHASGSGQPITVA